MPMGKFATRPSARFAAALLVWVVAQLVVRQEQVSGCEAPEDVRGE